MFLCCVTEVKLKPKMTNLYLDVTKIANESALGILKQQSKHL